MAAPPSSSPASRSHLLPRYEGLRYADFSEFVDALHSSFSKEIGPLEDRPTFARFNEFVAASGGRVCGSYLEAKQQQGGGVVLPKAVAVHAGYSYSIDRTGTVRRACNFMSCSACVVCLDVV